MQAAVRAASVQLLKDYAANAQIKLQVYPGRPASIHPPTAFVDRISTSFVHAGPELIQHNVRVSVVLLHGRFDSKEAADQRDAFVDGFVDWVASRFHAAGANTITGLVGVEDQAVYTPDWLPPSPEHVYYATEILLEGYAES